MATGECWRVLKIFLIKDFKIFISYLLSWFATWLFPFIVKGKRLLVGIKELGCKWQAIKRPEYRIRVVWSGIRG